MADEEHPRFRRAADRMVEEAFQRQESGDEPKAEQQRSSPGGRKPQDRVQPRSQGKKRIKIRFQLIKDQLMIIGAPLREMSGKYRSQSEATLAIGSDLKTQRIARQNDSDEMQLVKSRLTVWAMPVQNEVT